MLSGFDCLQGTLQKFLDDLFQAVLSIPPEKPPLAVKYFFDFLEEQADKRGITDPDTLHIWKTNRYRDTLFNICWMEHMPSLGFKIIILTQTYTHLLNL